MPKFYTNLRRSWVVNRLRVNAWYYRRRFPFFGGKDAACAAVTHPPFAARDFQLRFAEQEDALQALNIFRDGNAWNQLSFDTPPATIVDLGANRGFSTLFWRSRFPQARLHGIEMNADNIARCRRLFSENQLPGEFHQVAIGDRDGTLTYRAHASHTRHRLEKLLGTDEPDESYQTAAVEVPCLTLASFLRAQKIERVDLLKVDIEGAEQFLLETVDTWAASVRLMLLEIHHNINVEWARAQLLQAGFTIDLGDTTNRTEWWCRRIE